MEKQKGFWFQINNEERQAIGILKEENINISGFLRKCLRDHAKSVSRINKIISSSR